jgi:Xaa-Pro dipeptidase
MIDPRRPTMNRTFDAAHDAEMRRRHEAVVAATRAAGLRHHVVTDTENIFYLTAATFTPLERPFFLVVGADGSRRMLVPMLEVDHMRKAWGLAEDDIRFYREFPAPEGEGWADRLTGDGLVGAPFAFDDATPASVAAALSAAGGRALDLLAGVRTVKSDWEIARIERAAHYADLGVEDVLRVAARRGSVADTFACAGALTRRIVREVPGWDPKTTRVIAAAWPAPWSAEPHSMPRMADRLDAGPHVAMVLTRVDGYAAESERTFFTTPPTARERELFGLVSRAREIAFALVRPGVPCAAIDAAVNDFLSASGFGDFRTRLHRCGHGFGLGNHEPPWIAEGSPDVLARHMVISIEPGLYERGIGGYRHSDTVLVTDDGYRCLTRAPSTLDALVVPAEPTHANDQGGR